MSGELRKNIFRKAKGKAVVIFMTVLLTLTLSACQSPSAGSTDGDSSNEVSTTAPEQSASEIGNPAGDADAAAQAAEPSDNGDMDLDENGMMNVTITVGNEVFAAKFHDNESARAIVSQMPFTLEMDDYASQEKVTDLDFTLPSASTETPATINAGDIYLWSGNSLVLFYTTFSNSYSYVPVGYITDAAGLTDALGRGTVTVEFRIVE